MSLLPENIDPSWGEFLTNEIKEELERIEKKIGDHFNPTDKNKILRFLTVNLNKVKIVWLGQDVYPAKGVATGRSFEVGNLQSWCEPFRQVSLKNIIRLVHKMHNGIQDYADIKKFKDIQSEIKNGEFPIKPPKEWFDSLEEQGVLFLNSSYTCEIGKPSSHQKIWASFSIKVLNYISEQRPDLLWFLWGNHAIANKEHMKGVFFESRHPMMCSEKYVDDFLKFEGFHATKSMMNWLG